MAESALEDLSEDARFYGKDWPVAAVPPIIKRLILRAAVRHMRNVDGYETSRAGDETVQWSEKNGQDGTAHFLPDEIKTIEQAAFGKPTLRSASVFAFRNRATSRVGYVPTQNGDLFPMFSSETSPW